MAATDSSTIRRRRLGHELRRLREDAGVTVDEVATALDCSRAKISRIEGGRVGVRPAELVVMLDRYGISDQELRDSLVTLARESRRQTEWWTEYGSALSIATTYVGFEAAASSVWVYEQAVLPGLLQTQDYARLVLHSWLPDITDAGELDSLVAIRMARQERLADAGLEFWAVLDEAVLRRMVGGPSVMRAQLGKVLDATGRSNTRIQVLPFSVGTHAAMAGGFTSLHFPNPTDSAVVIVETQTSARYLDKPADVAIYDTAFRSLGAIALDPDRSVTFISAIAKEL